MIITVTEEEAQITADYMDDLQKSNRILAKALEYYASLDKEYVDRHNAVVREEHDGGKIAKAALKERMIHDT